uniref:Uncharacterized protein n=1 Tax=Chromera velia CCMP2878 TaxID=1169474 RepID=A0A0G4FL80_9ALVE|eukprot:Cvel_3469.t1-p1 / transcript=Cvel_3469.t1 / gene=Cvel_3469 / organism=Chromera_velia_CCMP2878 / gene_product=hypothetical protein / transcript_product=hypothetical protein / location=Cvel_scaffold140:7707-9100(-) / protein_length=122 / sequence_SO=supercontig / SO=protein_coding / is_pseudo=false
MRLHDRGFNSAWRRRQEVRVTPLIDRRQEEDQIEEGTAATTTGTLLIEEGTASRTSGSFLGRGDGRGGSEQEEGQGEEAEAVEGGGADEVEEGGGQTGTRHYVGGSDRSEGAPTGRPGFAEA